MSLGAQFGQPALNPNANASAANFKRLARLVIRAFYNGPCPPDTYRDPNDVEGSRSKLGKVDTTGLGIILMDYLVSKEWVGEADIVDDIKVHHKLIRRALKYLEREKLLMSEHRRETRRSQKKDVVKAVMDANAEAARDQEESEEETEQLQRPHTISYYALDFPKMFDAVQLRLYHMKKVIKDDLESTEVLAKYVCQGAWCKKEHDSLGVHWLINHEDGEMHCDICDSLVKQVLASGQTGDEHSRRQRRDMISSRLERMDRQLLDVIRTVSALRNSNAPFYGTLRDWAVGQQALHQRQQAQQGGRGGLGRSGAGMPGMLSEVAASANYWEDTQVEVNLGGAGADAAGASGSGAADAAVGPGGETKAVLPPWMLRPAGAGAGAAAAGAVDSKAAAAAEESALEQRQKAFAQEYMKAMMEGQRQRQLLKEQGLAAAEAEAPPAPQEPPAKRIKQEEQEPQQDAEIEWEAVAADAGPVVLGAASPAPGADDDNEWEDI